MKNLNPILLPPVVALGMLASGSTAFASEGIYAGAGMVHSGFVLDEGESTLERDQSKTSGGVYAGYKKSVLESGLFVSGEVFFNNTSHSKAYDNGDTVNVENQYGVKAMIGHEWGWGGSLYGTLGVAQYDYNIQLGDRTAGESRFGHIYGVGFDYQFNQSLSSHLELTVSGDEIDLNDEQAIDSGLVVVRWGVSYHF
ncbi:hypothetical protein HMF8227_02271 [Saliniradius amylolyticus]|uniref:Outer membrane protein beta-barrel domain-containing protein n=1 Tax=Saliniradius amylolyticus TaxID=2183582 RepID=A0A2S2E4Z6_9ALTE|nr:outer membrane beta-barrel protein [Saliniradius amylolyticus]AWL12724.1 hypothetical protein HMF8227_02271 [Saliniradius amylolyticus]